ncbi:hypothetical protein RJ639_014872 [Escallonia herrerae]|uniref:Uncharacterized protein n=1 Tax=Escallonia herrerae TaxID=1293975 RepID=A0AA89AMA3_9ASTE|nr:hypothetical protein RJ639_014872 [Escallonia herrerae]
MASNFRAQYNKDYNVFLKKSFAANKSTLTGKSTSSQRTESEDGPPPPSRRRLLGLAFENAVAQLYRIRLAEAEARLERASAREAEMNRLIKEMRRFVSVMEILDAYLTRCLVELQQELDLLK